MRAAFALVALLLIVGALVAQAPATLLDRRLADATRGAVRLADARGTVWSGGADVADAKGRWTVPVAWRVDPLAALKGEIAVTLLPAGPATARGAVVLRESELRATALDVVLPATILESVWTDAPVPRFDGVLHLRAPSWRIADARSEGAADLRWERAGVALAGFALNLGVVDAAARPGDGGTVVTLRNRGGHVAIDGELRVRDDGVRLDARLTPAAGLAAPLALLVRSLGTPDAAGSVRVTWQRRR
jgi:hypothetical protein